MIEFPVLRLVVVVSLRAAPSVRTVWFSLVCSLLVEVIASAVVSNAPVIVLPVVVVVDRVSMVLALIAVRSWTSSTCRTWAYEWTVSSFSYFPVTSLPVPIESVSEHWFESGPLVEAVLASSAVPALFPPIEIDGEHYYDGGLVDSVPLGRAVKLGADVIYVLQVGRMESPLRPPERLYEAALISFEIARRHRFATTMRELPEGVEVHVLPTGSPVAWDDRRQLKWKDTDGIEERMTTAYRMTLEYLEGIGA